MYIYTLKLQLIYFWVDGVCLFLFYLSILLKEGIAIPNSLCLAWGIKSENIECAWCSFVGEDEQNTEEPNNVNGKMLAFYKLGWLFPCM